MLVQRTHDFVGNADVNNYIIILGMIVAPILNFSVNLTWLIRKIRKRHIDAPSWLLYANLLLFILQFIFLFVIQTHPAYK
ncbi:hypothetical protein ACI6Q2_19600 [Chitinophagaceae bacterium LWZ2-11]